METEGRRDKQLVAAIWETRIPGTTGQAQGQARTIGTWCCLHPVNLLQVSPLLPDTRVLIFLWTCDKQFLLQHLSALTILPDSWGLEVVVLEGDQLAST